MSDAGHPSLTVFENSKDRLDLQVLDLTKGLAVLAWIICVTLAGVWFLFSGMISLAFACFHVAVISITAFVFLVGAKRLIVDASDDNLRVTYRALLRRTQIDIRLSDVQQFELISPDGQSATGPSELKPEGRKTKEKYLVQAQFDDRSPVVLFQRAGALGQDVGHILLEWWNDNGGRFRR